MALSLGYYALESKLFQLASKLDRWYTAVIPNVFVIYVYECNSDEDHEAPYGKHVFDIYADRIEMRDSCRTIPNDAITVIGEIQSTLQEIEKEVSNL